MKKLLLTIFVACLPSVVFAEASKINYHCLPLDVLKCGCYLKFQKIPITSERQGKFCMHSFSGFFADAPLFIKKSDQVEIFPTIKNTYFKPDKGRWSASYKLKDEEISIKYRPSDDSCPLESVAPSEDCESKEVKAVVTFYKNGERLAKFRAQGACGC